MPAITIAYGIVLTLLGVGGYFATGGVSATALIPSFFGLPLILLGWLARDERRLKMSMHIAAVLALLGAAGTASGLAKLGSVFAGEAEQPAAVLSQVAMFVLSVLFLVLCVRSFVQARRARAAA